MNDKEIVEKVLEDTGWSRIIKKAEKLILEPEQLTDAIKLSLKLGREQWEKDNHWSEKRMKDFDIEKMAKDLGEEACFTENQMMSISKICELLIKNVEEHERQRILNIFDEQWLKWRRKEAIEAIKDGGTG